MPRKDATEEQITTHIICLVQTYQLICL
jgi:hypothetical protein